MKLFDIKISENIDEFIEKPLNEKIKLIFNKHNIKLIIKDIISFTNFDNEIPKFKLLSIYEDHLDFIEHRLQHLAHEFFISDKEFNKILKNNNLFDIFLNNNINEQFQKLLIDIIEKHFEFSK